MLYVEAVITLSIYAIIILLAIRIYKRQPIKGVWWIILLFYFAGLFSISIDLSLFGGVHKLALFPIGVAIFYLFTINNVEARNIYKPYIWLGFLANYAFFIGSIFTLFMTNALFPPGQLATYSKSFEEATIFTIHPSASNQVQLSSNAYELLQHATQTEVNAHEWYTASKEEKFPYMLQNVTPAAGLKLDVLYYIERDGKGLLVQTYDEHYYFRTTESFIETHIGLNAFHLGGSAPLLGVNDKDGELQ